jgi:hypothetical protein
VNANDQQLANRFEFDDEPDILDDPQSAEDEDDPSYPATELVRLSDVVRSPEKFRELRDERYTPGYQATLQRPVFAAYKNGECPEFFESVRAAYAACYFLAEDANKQDIVEQSTAEALRLYVGCEHGLIKSTCTRCESTKSSRFELQFNIEGLKKLTVRICERLKKQERKRRYLIEETTSLLEEVVSDGGRTEDNLIAAIDAERGHIDTGNEHLMQFLPKIFSKRELKVFLNPPSKDDPWYLQLVQRFRKYFFENPQKTSSVVPY